MVLNTLMLLNITCPYMGNPVEHNVATDLSIAAKLGSNVRAVVYTNIVVLEHLRDVAMSLLIVDQTTNHWS
jgi:hypothetical protein